MLSIWCLMHGTAMLIIRGNFEGALRTQAIHSCQDAVETLLKAARRKQLAHSGPKWPANLILGEGTQSKVGNENSSNQGRPKRTTPPR